jgi:hypothetical protein
MLIGPAICLVLVIIIVVGLWIAGSSDDVPSVLRHRLQGTEILPGE